MLKLIDFWAQWCPPCKTMAPIVEEIAEELRGKVEVVQVDVDKEQEKASRYEIFSIPTFVLENDGKEVARITGARSKDALKNWIEEHLGSV